MTMAGSFLGGAKDRLLPLSVPFRFFVTATVFQAAAWVALFLGAPELAGYAGGTGMVLAAIHLLTLGVLALTAMGAAYQLLPVVTRRPMARVWPARLSFWLIVPGTLVLSWGMATTQIAALNGGAALVSAALVLFALLTGHNLARARALAVVAAHGWGALGALCALVVIAWAAIANIGLGSASDAGALARAHMILAGFGFMGLLVLGLSMVLIPMFTLSPGLSRPAGWAQLGLTATALILFTLATLGNLPSLGTIALIPGFAAGGMHFTLMRAALRTGMRKRLGLSFLMIRSAWAYLGLALILGAAILLGAPLPPSLFGFVLLAGWLATFLTGILQRIMPFLASMHGSGRNSGRTGAPILLSELTAQAPLRLHAICHHLALIAVMGGIALDLPMAIRAGAAIATIGALAFAGFAANVVIRLRGPA